MTTAMTTAPPTSIPVFAFYQCCVKFHPDCEEPSPLASNAAPIYSPVGDGPYRITSETSRWWNRARRQVASGHPCLLVEYNPVDNTGVIFMATSRQQLHPHRFVIVGRTSENVFVETVTERLFPEPTVVNFTHPLRVKLHYVTGDTLNVLRNLPSVLDTPGTIPTVGMREYVTQPRDAVRLSEQGIAVFKGLHRKYHMDRRGGAGGGEDGAAGGGGNGGNRNPQGGIQRGVAGAGALGPGEMAAPLSINIGPFVVGTHIPATFEDVDVDYEADDEPVTSDPVFDLDSYEGLPLSGDLFIWDIDLQLEEEETDDVVLSMKDHFASAASPTVVC